MELDEYRDFTNETAIYGDSVDEVLRQAQVSTGDVLGKWMRLAYAAGKLNGEAGEIAEEVFKALRDDKCELTMERKAKIRKELGDSLYYHARIAVELDVSLGDVAAENMTKLRDRKARGVIEGSGGDR
jgi:NTP pyrophosphatase (non-canonical NTP hydrolase)